jgi:hypothetical protein
VSASGSPQTNVETDEQLVSRIRAETGGIVAVGWGASYSSFRSGRLTGPICSRYPSGPALY